MNRQREIEHLMKRAGFTRIRSKRHTIWKHECGAVISTAQSPSDLNAIRQAKRQLARICQQHGIPFPE